MGHTNSICWGRLEPIDYKFLTARCSVVAKFPPREPGFVLYHVGKFLFLLVDIVAFLTWICLQGFVPGQVMAWTHLNLSPEKWMWKVWDEIQHRITWAIEVMSLTGPIAEGWSHILQSTDTYECCLEAEWAKLHLEHSLNKKQPGNWAYI